MIDPTDKSLAKAAIDKMKIGVTPTAREAGALKRIEREKEESRRWEYYRSIPAKHYKEMSGRPARVLIDQQQRLGIPVAGKVVNLPAVLKWVHDFLAKHSHLPLTAEEMGAGGAGGSKALERYRTAMAEEKELEVAHKRRETAPMDEVEEMMGTVVARLVRCLNTLENSLALEFSIWLASPAVKAMSTEERQRMVRDFVAKTCREVRSMEAADMRAMARACLANAARSNSGDGGDGDSGGEDGDADDPSLN